MKVIYKTIDKTIYTFAQGNLPADITSMYPELNWSDYTVVDIDESSLDMEDLLKNLRLYTVNDGVSPAVLVKGTQMYVKMSCNQTLISGYDYEMAAGGTAQVTANFKDDQGNPATPTGTLKLTCSRGSLANKSIALDGSASSVNVNWTSVNETVLVQFTGNIPELVEYKQGRMTIDLI